MLELQGLSRRYGDVVALDDLSFTVREGQMFGFIGPNGAGKTTAMRIILGVLEADAGEVLWRGRPMDDEARRRVGYMPEERGLYPKMRVRDQLEYFARLHGLSPHDAQEATTYWTERLGVAERAGDRVEALSLGNQQRVQLAAGLVHGLNLGYGLFNVTLTVGWLVVLYRRRDEGYHRFRGACLVTHLGAQPAFYNPVAAMPSLHVAFAVVTGGEIAERSGSVVVRTAARAYAPLVATVVAGTGNHYVLDAVAGAALGAAARRLS